MSLDPASSFARDLLKWYDQSQRRLPWRADPATRRRPSAYHVLVSELMLQQTQVATVIPYFHRFIARFPDFAALARADEQEVLRLWQGLGYYARARHLQKTAKAVVERYDGRLPESLPALLDLPGIGRYTAGAIRSIAFDRPAPILDGNVMRVLCRLDDIRTDPRERSTQARLWSRAEALVPAERPGDFNAALMELGALICVPRAPRCLLCPVQAHCRALMAGTAAELPKLAKRAPTPLVHRRVYCIQSHDRWLIEQRPDQGRWRGMWQFITRPADATPESLPVRIGAVRPLGLVRHALTHRRYEFEVLVADYSGDVGPPDEATREWTTLAELERFPLSRPQLKIADLLAAAAKK